jgi:hypothetical protein
VRRLFEWPMLDTEHPRGTDQIKSIFAEIPISLKLRPCIAGGG